MNRLCFAPNAQDAQAFAQVHQNHLQVNKKIFILIFTISLLYLIADIAFYSSTNDHIDYPILIPTVGLQLIRLGLFLFYLKVGSNGSNKRFQMIEAIFLVIFGISSIVSWELQLKQDPSKVFVVATEASWTFLFIHTLFFQFPWKALVYIFVPLFAIYRTVIDSHGFNLGFIQAVLQMVLILSSSYIEELWKRMSILQNVTLEKTGQTLRTILNSLPDNIAILNLDGDIRFYNEYFGISFKLSENITNTELFSKLYQVKPRERHLNLQKLQERYNFVRPTRKTARKSQSVRRESLINPESFSSPLTQYLTDEFKNSNAKGTSVIGPKGERKQLFRTKSARFSQLAPLKTLTEFFSSINHFKDFQEVLDFLIENVNIIRTYTEKERSFFIFDAKYATSEGVVKSYEIKISLSNFDGEESFIMILRDTTMRDIIVTLEDHNNFKDSVLSSISHELKTPLNTNLNLIQLAIEAFNKIEKNGKVPIWNSGSVENFSIMGVESSIRKKGDFKESYLIPAHKSGKLLESLINDIVDYSMLLARKFVITIKQKDLTKSLEKIRYMCEFQALKKFVDFQIDVAPELNNFKIGTDHKRLRQILTNLINNAIKFTNQGSVILKIEPYCENPELIQFSVIDTGIGLDRIALERIITLLDSGNFLNKLNQEATGVGMGLIVSQLLAREIGPKAVRMSGLRIESKLGEGSKFWFVIENWKKGSEVIESKLLDDTTSMPIQEDGYGPLSPQRTSLGRISLEVNRAKRGDGTRIDVRSPIHEREDQFEDTFALSINDEFNDEDEIDEEDAQEIRDANLIKSMSSGRYFAPSIDSKSMMMNNRRLGAGSESPSAFLSSHRYLELSPQSTFLHLNPNLSIFGNRTILIPTPPNEPADFQDALEQPSHICICAEVLVVDDDMFNLFTMENLLGSFNFNIEKANNGQEAIQVAKKRTQVKCSELCSWFKLIFMDISMPVMDGFESTTKLKEMMRNGEIPEVPIIACTAFVEDDKVTKCFECGMSDKVTKPVNQNKIREILKKYDVIEKSRSEA